jgi:hypothetical protein
MFWSVCRADAENLARHPMRGLVTVNRDGARQSALALERPTEKRLGRGYIPLCAGKEIDRLSLLVDGSVEVGPTGLIFTYVSSTRQETPARHANWFHRFSNSGT